MKRPLTLVLFLALATILAAGCKHSQPKEESLPLPPVGDSGLANGWYVQAEYGFALPVPKGYGSYAPNLEDQPAEEFDEWIRFMDAKKESIIRLFSEDREIDGRFTEADLKKEIGEVFTSGDYQVEGTGKTLEWYVGKEHWIVVPYDLKDKVKKTWRTWVCAIGKQDYVVWVRATLPRDQAQKGAGDKLLSTLKDCLSQVKWYQPVGPRGISLEHFELQKFDSDFIAALESGSVAKTLTFFDETSPARYQWADRYKMLTAPVEGKGNSPDALKAVDAGLVIDGKRASAYFNLKRGNQELAKLGFHLSKEDRSWSIVSVERIDKH
jgi:hypothetical protein